MEDFTIRVGKRIREFRKNLDLSLDKLAESAGLTGKFLGRVERGEVTISVNNLGKVASALGIDVFALLDCEHEKSRKDLLLEVNAMTNEDIITCCFYTKKNKIQ